MLGAVAKDYAYPPDLAAYAVSNWPSAQQLWLSSSLLAEALAIAFQASFMAEEGRPARFRLLLTPFESLPESGLANKGVQRLRFVPSRPLTADELRRLSPSAEFESSLIGVHVEDERLRIWGLAHSGPAWLASAWGGRRVVPNWTFDPIIHVSGPGQLGVRCAGRLIGALERGELIDTQMDVFESKWLPALFEAERESVRKEHEASQADADLPTQVEHPLIGRVAQQMLRRAIRLVRNARHGGMLLFVDALGKDPDALLRNIRLKYSFEHDEPSRRFRTLLLQILRVLAASSTKPSVDWSDFATDKSPALERLEQAVFELSRLIANLAGVDGAVILDKRFALHGFGGEVSGELPSPTEVWRATDAEGEQLVSTSIESVGTRHRAAYRFVQAHPRGLAIVISQDGSVSFVTERAGKVVFWEQSVGP